jgi:hypothetical protein
MTIDLSRKRQFPPWQNWYGRTLWLNRRAHQLRIEPLCRYCKADGRIVAAQVVDHIVAHNGDWNLFARGELQSLCAPCHDSRKRTIDLRGYSMACDEQGNPTDPNHPSYTRKPETLRPCGECGSGWHTTDEHQNPESIPPSHPSR